MESAVFHTPLIHGLPDDIALLCLARVPRQYHNALRCVSKRWGALLCSEEWHSCRKRNNLDESWVYVICIDTDIKCYVLAPDPTTRSLKVMQVMEPPCSGREDISIETLDKRLYLLGGFNRPKDANDEVYCYDASSNRWSIAAPMPTARDYFASAALNGKLYITGGEPGWRDKPPNSWDIYDSGTNSWYTRNNPMLIPGIVKFVALDGELVTIHQTFWHNHAAGVYDPLDRSWRGTENEIVLCWSGPTVVVDGTLYLLSLGTKLMMWQKETKEWVMLGRLSDKLTRPPCGLVAIGRKIYVIGSGLSTVTIDLDTAAKVGSWYPLPQVRWWRQGYNLRDAGLSPSEDM